MQDLEARFAPGEERSVIASATLTELIYTHRERLETALRQERRLLLEAQNISAADDRGTSSKASSLMDAAERNLALSKELIQTNSPTTRSATQNSCGDVLDDERADRRDAGSQSKVSR